MAQIWVSVEELAELCSCSPGQAREQMRSRPWPARQCHDGEVRVKLPEDLAAAYIQAMASRFNGQAARGLSDRADRRLRVVPPSAGAEIIAYSIGQ